MLIAIEASHANKSKRTGVEQVCWHVIQELKKIIPSNTRVVLYCNEPLQGELANLPENWSVKILKWPFKKGWSQIRLSLEFLFHPPDVFLAPGQLVPFICPKNTISIVHDSAFKVFPSAYSFLSRTYLHWMNKLLVKKSKLIITPSEFSKKELIKYYSIKEDRVKVVPWAYDRRAYYMKENEEILKKYNITKPFIMSLGRLEEKKNTANIIKAFNILKENNNQLKLVLVGEPGRGYEKVEREIFSSPYTDDIVMPGWVDDDLPYLLSSASVFVFPSFYEGFGLPVLEAMACACPVVLSKGNSLEEVGGEAVDYVVSDDVEGMVSVINKLLNNESYRENIVNAGLKRVKLFSWFETSTKVYNWLISA